VDCRGARVASPLFLQRQICAQSFKRAGRFVSTALDFEEAAVRRQAGEIGVTSAAGLAGLPGVARQRLGRRRVSNREKSGKNDGGRGRGNNRSAIEVNVDRLPSMRTSARSRNRRESMATKPRFPWGRDQGRAEVEALQSLKLVGDRISMR
jgi:hypothetical protein